MPDPLPIDEERALLAAAVLRNHATAALNTAGCRADSIELFTPTIEQRLRIGPEGVVVLDDDGAPRRGVTPAQYAREVSERYERTERGRYFDR